MEPHAIAHPHRVISRAAAVIGLLGIALIHLLDLQSKFHETPYLGVLYLLLIAASLATAAALIRRDEPKAWTAAALISGATIAGYAINRTVGMPGATEDIGNWLEPLGLASLFVEGIVCAVSVYALSDRQARTKTREVSERRREPQFA